MPGRRIVLAALLAGCALCPPPSDALDAASLLIAGCPGTNPAATGLDVEPLLPTGWRRKMSPSTCADLTVLALRYARRPSSAVPAASDLRTLALTLQTPPTPPHSFWKHIGTWLRRRLEPLDWLLKWLHSLPAWSVGPSSRTALLVAMSALLLLGVAAFGFVGLRAAGLIGALRRPSSRGHRRVAQARKAVGAGPLDRDAEAMQTPERPVLALRMLMNALRRSQRIERDGGLTCREVVARALFDTLGQREEFATVALLAERELYGPDGSPIQMPDELRASVQALYDQLLAAPVAAGSAS